MGFAAILQGKRHLLAISKNILLFYCRACYVIFFITIYIVCPMTTDFSTTYNDLPPRLRELHLNPNPQWPNSHLPVSEQFKRLNEIEEMQDKGRGFWNCTTLGNYRAILQYIHDNRHAVEKLMGMPLPEARKAAGEIIHTALADGGIKINYYGKTAHELGHKNVLAVSNHFGWLDGIMLFARTGVATAGKVDAFKVAKIASVMGFLLGGYRGLGSVVNASQLAFVPVERGEAKGNNKMANHERMEADARRAIWQEQDGANQGLMIFSERTTAHGHQVAIQPSSTAARALFEEGDMSKPLEGAVIQPIAMVVHKVEGREIPAGEKDKGRDKISWYGKGTRSMFTHLAGNTLPTRTKGGIEMDVYLLPPIEVSKLHEKGIEPSPRSVINVAFGQIDQVLKTSREKLMEPELKGQALDFLNALEGNTPRV